MAVLVDQDGGGVLAAAMPEEDEHPQGHGSAGAVPGHHHGAMKGNDAALGVPRVLHRHEDEPRQILRQTPGPLDEIVQDVVHPVTGGEGGFGVQRSAGGLAGDRRECPCREDPGSLSQSAAGFPVRTEQQR